MHWPAYALGENMTQMRVHVCQVCEEQATQLRQADEQIHSLEEQLNQALKQIKDLQVILGGRPYRRSR